MLIFNSTRSKGPEDVYLDVSRKIYKFSQCSQPDAKMLLTTAAASDPAGTASGLYSSVPNPHGGVARYIRSQATGDAIYVDGCAPF